MLKNIKRALGFHASFGDEDDELTEGMTSTSADIMMASMDVQPFQDIEQPGGAVTFGIEYGDMSMSSSGNVSRRENLPDPEALGEDYPSFQPEYLHFGSEGVGHHGAHDDFGIGVIIPASTAQSAVPPSVPPPQPQDGSDGMGYERNQYGRGGTGEPLNTSLADSSGGIDPFANAAFGEEDEGPPGAIDLMALNEGEDMDFQPVGDDAWDVPEHRPTLRNPVTRFEGEYYNTPSSGPAPILAGESSIAGPMSLIGCDMGQGRLLR
jgi:hypothetical protein